MQYKNRMLDLQELERMTLICLEGATSTRSYLQPFPWVMAPADSHCFPLPFHPGSNRSICSAATDNGLLGSVTTLK